MLRVRTRLENHMRRDGKFTDSICRVVVQLDDCFWGQEKLQKRCGLSAFNGHNICMPFWLSYMLVVKDGK